ncbi:Unknown protein sequence [Pseudomonas syringae pv. syringae]|nr:Unknown protein sequence [Pseudomonas syringae pv. syringae]
MRMLHGFLLVRVLAVIMIVVMSGGILDRRAHSCGSRILLVAK